MDEEYSVHHVKTAFAFALLLASACSSPLKAPTVQGPPPDYVEPVRPVDSADGGPLGTARVIPPSLGPVDAGAP